MSQVVTQLAYSNAPGAIALPDTYTDAYSDTDRRKLVRIVEWLNATRTAPDAEGRWTQARLAKAAGVKGSTFSQVLTGRYPSSPTVWLDNAGDAIARHQVREREQVRPVPYVHTSVHKRVRTVCNRAFKQRAFGVVAGAVGVGKTRALKHYAERESGVYYVRAMHSMSVSVLLDELVTLTGATVHKTGRHGRGTQPERLAGVKRALDGRDALLILDEADHASDGALETLRYLSDEARVGVVLAGNASLKYLLADTAGKFGQITSRIVFRGPLINAISETDAHAITRAAFAAYGDAEPGEEILDACWQVCEGSARVLGAALIPALRDFVLRKNLPLTAKLVYACASDVLGFHAQRRAS